jgi:hypothetical protein
MWLRLPDDETSAPERTTDEEEIDESDEHIDEESAAVEGIDEERSEGGVDFEPDPDAELIEEESANVPV